MRLQLEHDNLRAALEWALEGVERGLAAQTDLGLRLSTALWPFWYLRGYWAEGSEWQAAMLLHTKSAHTGARAGVLFGAGTPAVEQGDYVAGRRLVEESLAAYKEAGDQAHSAIYMERLGDIAYVEGDYLSARTIMEEALTLSRSRGTQPK